MKNYIFAVFFTCAIGSISIPTVSLAETPLPQDQKAHTVALLKQIITLLELQKQFVLQNPSTQNTESSAHTFKIVRAEHAIGSSAIEVYFDKPVYRDNNSFCYLSDTLTDLKSLCALDNRHAQIITANDVNDIYLNALRPTDERDLSHITLDVVDDLKKLDDGTPRFVQMVNVGENITAPAPFPIKVYPEDKTQLQIKSIVVGIKGKSTRVAQIGDIIEVRVQTNKPLWGMGFSARVHDSVSDFGHDLKITKIADTEYTATIQVTSNLHAGPLSFEFYNFADLWQTGLKDSSEITKTTDGSTLSVGN